LKTLLKNSYATIDIVGPAFTHGHKDRQIFGNLILMVPFEH